MHTSSLLVSPVVNVWSCHDMSGPAMTCTSCRATSGNVINKHCILLLQGHKWGPRERQYGEVPAKAPLLTEAQAQAVERALQVRYGHQGGPAIKQGK